MDTSRFLSWLQIVGTAGILAGLILVGVQISQATDLARLQLENEWMAQRGDRSLVIMGESPAAVLAKAATQPESLTDEELVVLESYLNVYLEYWYNLKVFSDMGIIDDARWRLVFDLREGDREYNAMIYYFGNPVSQAWWDAVSQAGGWREDPEFFDAADAAIRALRGTEMKEWRDLVRKNLARRLED